MDQCSEIWNLLHDATIIGIAGEVPGVLRLDLKADYLRRRFAESGDRFILSLHGCRRFTFRPWDTADQATTDIVEIGRRNLRIPSADQAEEHCIVHCSGSATVSEGGGTLEVATDGAILALDSGRPVTPQELTTVSDAYWAAWESRRPREVSAPGS
jgi:hypothetical protein